MGVVDTVGCQFSSFFQAVIPTSLQSQCSYVTQFGPIIHEGKLAQVGGWISFCQ